jgi:hypothetical protein
MFGVSMSFYVVEWIKVTARVGEEGSSRERARRGKGGHNNGKKDEALNSIHR